MKKQRSMRYAFILLCCWAFSSCAGLPFGMISSRGWPGSGGPDPLLPRVSLGDIRVDKAGDYSSLETELTLLLPLLLSEKGFTVVAPGDSPDFIVRGRATEREYLKNWRTVRSISAEVYLYVEGNLPYASARASASGTRSLASSGDMEALFRSALNKLVRAVERREP
ncbi:MAG: hypothetical protein LBK40_01735 [Spirochaetaceae bacterium]|jgi:hypothetical protein|nr:hypothetical protein [Spirochaetaceae bacterium]